MSKAKKDTRLNNRFRSEDVAKWQLQADKQTGGNLTLWIELTLNKNAKTVHEEFKELSEKSKIELTQLKK